MAAVQGQRGQRKLQKPFRRGSRSEESSCEGEEESEDSDDEVSKVRHLLMSRPLRSWLQVTTRLPLKSQKSLLHNQSSLSVMSDYALMRLFMLCTTSNCTMLTLLHKWFLMFAESAARCD